MKPVSQKGTVAILVALLLPVLMGLMALAIDMGYVLLKRNEMQVAADSAALFAASARQHGQDIGAASSLVQAATAANGFLNNLQGTVVTVLIPPGGSQSYAADTQYVSVTVTQPVNAFLAWIFGVIQTNTSATAVAGPAGGGNPCLLTLGTSGTSLSVVGNSVVTANTCGIYVNSNSGSALQVTGNVTVTATPILVVGGYSKNGNVTMGPVTTGAAATTDPFSNLPFPAFSACNYTNYSKSGNGDLVLSAGTYCGGISINGNHGVTFSPGMYILYGGGLNLTGNISPIQGSDVTIYNSGNSSTYPYAALDLSGNVSINFSAPTAGAYAGMLFMQDPENNQTASIAGNSGTILAGNLYFPNSALNLTGNSGTSIPTGSVVAQKISVNGNSKFKMTNTYGGSSNNAMHSGLYQ